MCSDKEVRKASLSPQAGGMSDVQLRRYNSNERVLENDPIYMAFSDTKNNVFEDPIYREFPELITLGERMRNRTLKTEEYDRAVEIYDAERIRLLEGIHYQDLRKQREAMFNRSRPMVLKDGFGNSWVHPTPPATSGYAAH